MTTTKKSETKKRSQKCDNCRISMSILLSERVSNASIDRDRRENPKKKQIEDQRRAKKHVVRKEHFFLDEIDDDKKKNATSISTTIRASMSSSSSTRHEVSYRSGRSLADDLN